MKNTEQYLSPTHLIEPYSERKARTATTRKASIERESAKLRAVYERLRLPVPSILIPADEPLPVTPKAKTHGRRRRRGGSKPHPARLAAIAAGRKIYRGSPCRRGHSGLRYVAQSDCVECARLRRRGRLGGRTNLTMSHGRPGKSGSRAAPMRSRDLPWIIGLGSRKATQRSFTGFLEKGISCEIKLIPFSIK